MLKRGVLRKLKCNIGTFYSECHHCMVYLERNLKLKNGKVHFSKAITTSTKLPVLSSLIYLNNYSYLKQFLFKILRRQKKMRIFS